LGFLLSFLAFLELRDRHSSSARVDSISFVSSILDRLSLAPFLPFFVLVVPHGIQSSSVDGSSTAVVGLGSSFGSLKSLKILFFLFFLPTEVKLKLKVLSSVSFSCLLRLKPQVLLKVSSNLVRVEYKQKISNLSKKR
jgi:hypothetical protein